MTNATTGLIAKLRDAGKNGPGISGEDLLDAIGALGAAARKAGADDEILTAIRDEYKRVTAKRVQA